MKVKQRGGRYLVVGTINGRFLRLALGTSNYQAASTAVNKIELAIGEGANSSRWLELKKLLPEGTFAAVAKIAGHHEAEPVQAVTGRDLEAAFEAWMHQRIVLGRLAQSTRDRYKQTMRDFASFLEEKGVRDLASMNRAFIESFKVWRMGRISEKKFSRGGTGLVLDAAILHRVFSFAVENEMILKNPVRLEGKPGENPTNGAEPFSEADLANLRQKAGPDMLMFLLLRWTGLRGIDAVKLTWDEVHFDRKEIERVTQNAGRESSFRFPRNCSSRSKISTHFGSPNRATVSY